MNIFPQINLPLPILCHALGCCFIGLKLTFIPPPYSNTPGTHASNPPPAQDRTVLGIATIAIGLVYLSTAYMPLEQNSVLYASAPVRIMLAGIAGAKLALDHFGKRNMGPGSYDDTGKAVRTCEGRDGNGVLWGIMLYDGLGGLLLGWWLGTLSGKIPALSNHL
jgi:hypothetical protein